MEKDLCAGCFRTIDEIARWSTASDEEKRQVVTSAAQRARKRNPCHGRICNGTDG
ncbi:MAG: DUF1289 domain-containing protein [Sulfuritalea sp.]|nr:DUF1289 domain-containing protein [Sulfuritalea sp.]